MTTLRGTKDPQPLVDRIVSALDDACKRDDWAYVRAVVEATETARRSLAAVDERRAPVQGDWRHIGSPDPDGTITWEEHLEVYDAYAARYGRARSAERIAQRGGFGRREAENLLGRPLKSWMKESAERGDV